MTVSGEKARSSVEVGIVVTVVGFLVTLAFNAGIQYSQINSLKAIEQVHSEQIKDINAQAAISKEKQEVQNNLTNVSLAHIETMVEAMRATQELKSTGVMR